MELFWLVAVDGSPVGCRRREPSAGQFGELDETLIVMAGEFGRTLPITLLEKHYALPGRDHYRFTAGAYHLRIGDFPILTHAVPLAILRG